MINRDARFSLGISLLAWIALCSSGSHATAQEKDKEAKRYSYATKGIMQFQSAEGPGKTEYWKLLLDESNLGGKELEMVELTLPAGEVVGSHHHAAVEIFYVLSGTLGHEVNGHLHMLTPGMVGVVRPEDSVRHIVPKQADVKLLVIWAPAGEAKKYFAHAKTTPIKQN